MKKPKTFAVIADACRLILAAVFIFSGITKSIDPWGLAVKVPDLLDFVGLGCFSSWSAGLAILLSAAELTLGLILLFRVGPGLAALLSLIVMAGFTLLTLVLAIWNPLDDCGCFGDAIKVSNWQSFYKNLILLPISIVVWCSCKGKPLFSFSRREIIITLLLAAASGLLGICSWRHLPIVDLLPYKVGVDIRHDVMCNRCADSRIRLVYTDRLTGLEHEFALTDTTWYDSERWEFVRTTTPYDNNPPRITKYDFALWRGGYNVADEIVYNEGTVRMIFIGNEGTVGRCCEKVLVPYLKRTIDAGDGVAIFVMGVAAGQEAPADYTIGGVTLPCYGMEMALRQEMLRADAGLVELRDGVIVRKRNCRDL